MKSIEQKQLPVAGLDKQDCREGGAFPQGFDETGDPGRARGSPPMAFAIASKNLRSSSMAAMAMVCGVMVLPLKPGRFCVRLDASGYPLVPHCGSAAVASLKIPCPFNALWKTKGFTIR